jgi:hypothetical protein
MNRSIQFHHNSLSEWYIDAEKMRAECVLCDSLLRDIEGDIAQLKKQITAARANGLTEFDADSFTP